MRELDAIRQYYAEELRAVANLSEALVRAFAKVPREHFLGPGPWQILNPSHLIDDNNEATYYRDPFHFQRYELNHRRIYKCRSSTEEDRYNSSSTEKYWHRSYWKSQHSDICR